MIKEIKKGGITPFRIWYNEWVEKNAKGNVLDVGKSRFWEYGFPTIDNDKEMNPTFVDDICDCKFPSYSFDTVLCNGVYQMVRDGQKMIDEIYRILKIDGVVLFGFAGTGYRRYNLNAQNWIAYDNDADFGKFKILDKKDFDKQYHYIVCQKYY